MKGGKSNNKIYFGVVGLVISVILSVLYYFCCSSRSSRFRRRKGGIEVNVSCTSHGTVTKTEHKTVEMTEHKTIHQNIQPKRRSSSRFDQEENSTDKSRQVRGESRLMSKERQNVY